MKKFSYLFIALIMVGVVGSRVGADVPDAPDPAVIPLPPFDDAVADPAKAVVIKANFASRTAASVSGAAVSIQRAHTHIGDPPILRLTLKDGDGATISQMNAWSPLWNFYTDGGREHMSLLPSAEGTFVVPFSPELATVTVRDIALAQDVVTADVTGPIHDFCSANPSDPDCREADLGVDSVSPTGPLFAVLGKPVTVTVGTVVSNGGPDGPVDAVVTREATGDAGLTITPAGPHTTDVAALAVGEARPLSEGYEVTCTLPGAHTLTLTSSIAPQLATVVDANGTNDSKTATFVVDSAVPVTINIQPGSTVNPVNLNGSTLPLAVLTTTASEYGNPLAFDATQIDPLSVRFGSESLLLAGAGVPETHGKGHPEKSLELDEKTRDGDTDMVLHFSPRRAALAPTDTFGCVVGRTATPSGPITFFGCDKVQVKG